MSRCPAGAQPPRPGQAPTPCQPGTAPAARRGACLLSLRPPSGGRPLRTRPRGLARVSCPSLCTCHTDSSREDRQVARAIDARDVTTIQNLSHAELTKLVPGRSHGAYTAPQALQPPHDNIFSLLVLPARARSRPAIKHAHKATQLIYGRRRHGRTLRLPARRAPLSAHAARGPRRRGSSSPGP